MVRFSICRWVHDGGPNGLLPVLGASERDDAAVC
jgi:hypothetical protein